jgi:hypothetical protein
MGETCTFVQEKSHNNGFFGDGNPQPERDLPSDMVDASDGMKEITARAWFSKCWSFQEFILARRILVCCGTLEKEWEVFMTETRPLNHDTPTFNQQAAAVAIEFATTLKGLQAIRDRHRQGHIPFSELLMDSWTRNAGDKRDKVYSVLGLLPTRIMAPNYNISDRTVWVAATKACILHERTLAVLILAGSDPDIPNSGAQFLPSWCICRPALECRPVKHRYGLQKPILAI